MNINGTNTLACLCYITPPGERRYLTTSQLLSNPLPHVGVIKDLVPDMTNFYDQYRSIKPWLQTKSSEHDLTSEHLQSQVDRKKLDGMCGAFCVLVVPRLARRTGGTPIRTWALPC